MNNNNGFFALGVLVIVMLFMASRAVDDDGRVTIGDYSGIDAPEVVRVGNADHILIPPDRGGSFLTEVEFNGARVDVLIDTGASFVTLRESDALRAGINPNPRDYRHEFSTANGRVMAARAEVDEVELGPALLEDVTVFVLPDDRLDVSLFGMNALRRFERWEVTSAGMRIGFD